MNVFRYSNKHINCIHLYHQYFKIKQKWIEKENTSILDKQCIEHFSGGEEWKIINEARTPTKANTTHFVHVKINATMQLETESNKSKHT